MHDLRFYRSLGPFSARALADELNAEVIGDASREIISIASAMNCGPSELCFFDGRPSDAHSISSEAGICLVTEAVGEIISDDITRIVVSDPKAAFTTIASKIVHLRDLLEDNLDLPEANISNSSYVAQSATISAGVEIGAHTSIGPNVTIGPGVRIGSGCVIGAGSVIETSLIGNDVTIKANSVLGGSGFGLAPTSDGLRYIPHFGRVIVQDNAGIGSCVCIDRGAFDDTVIGEGAKLDNLVQVGHNVKIGRNAIIAAFGGISGSVQVGDNVMMGGRVGIGDHLKIGDGARLAADSAVMRDVPSKETWAGTPAKPIKQMMREVAWLTKQATQRRK